MVRGKQRERLLEVGVELLGDRGFSATGIQEIATAAAMPKGSFYNYFPSKEAFAIAVLDRYREGACADFRRRLAAAEGSPVERLRALFSGILVSRESGAGAAGCLAGRLAQELAGENPAFREPLERTFEAFSGPLAKVLEEARAAGELDPGLDVEAYAAFLVTSWQGALLRAKSAGNDEPIHQFFQFALGRVLRQETATN